ncbi:MAG: outer membrane beta-barrel protein [Lishizhenia sp.]
MKKIIVLTLIGLISSMSWSQEEEEVTIKTEIDTTVIKLKKTEILVIDKGEDEGVQIETKKRKDVPRNGNFDTEFPEESTNHEGHWAGIDIGVNMFLNENGQASFDNARYLEINPAKSWNWNINFAEKRFKIVNNYIGLTTGLGLNVTNFTFQDNFIYNYSSDTISALVDTVVSYNKNKLRATYLTIPLLLEFHSSKIEAESFYLSAGVVGGVNLTSKLKRESDQEGYETKFSEKGDYGLNPFKLDAMLRVGYNNWGLYASYNLIPILDTDLTTTAHHASFGLSYNF